MAPSTEVSQLITFTTAIILIISLGLIAKKARLLSGDDAKTLNKLIVNFTLPAFIFNAVSGSLVTLQILKIAILAVGVTLICAGLAFFVGRFLALSPRTYSAFILASMVGNTGYLGFPLTQAIFGQGELSNAVLYDLVGTVIMVFTLGVFIAKKLGESTSQGNGLVDVLKFPPVIAFIAALIIPASVIPGFVMLTLSYVGQATVLLIMFSIGLSLDPSHVGRYKGLISMVVGIKLIAAPATALIMARVLNMEATMASICVMEAGMPTALITSVFGLHYKLDNDFLPAAIIGTTVCSLLTVPVLLTILR